MHLKPAQLHAHLQQTLAPIYLLSGDEPLQLMEAQDAIRHAAHTRGYTQREVFDVETGFDWQGFLYAGQNLSLFASHRLLELRIPTGKPGIQGAKALDKYVANMPPDTILLVNAGKIEKNARWTTVLDKAGIWVLVSSLNAAQLEAWIAQRLKTYGFHPAPAAVNLLLERSEGNMLAAAQEIQKLAMLCPQGGKLDERTLIEAVTDSSRYSIFDLSDALINADGVRICKILHGLEQDGTEPLLLLWLLSKEIRTVLELGYRQAKGEPVQQIAKSVRSHTLRSRLPTILKRHPYIYWERLLKRCAHIDRVLKGQQAGNAWEELRRLALGFAGIRC